MRLYQGFILIYVFFISQNDADEYALLR